MSNNQNNNEYDSFDLGPSCEEFEEIRPTGTVWVSDALIDQAANKLAAFMASERQLPMMPHDVKATLTIWLESYVEDLLTDAARDERFPFAHTGKDLVGELERDARRRNRRAYQAIALAEETF